MAWIQMPRLWVTTDHFRYWNMKKESIDRYHIFRRLLPTSVTCITKLIVKDSWFSGFLSYPLSYIFMTLIPLMLLKSYSDYMTVECIVLIKYEENYYITLYRFEYHLQAHESNRDKDTFAFIPNKFLLNLVIIIESLILPLRQ